MWHEWSLGEYMKLAQPSSGLQAEIQAWRPETVRTVRAPLGGAKPRMLQLSLVGSGTHVGAGELGLEVRVTVTNVDGTGDEVRDMSEEAGIVEAVQVGVTVGAAVALSSASAVVSVGSDSAAVVGIVGTSEVVVATSVEMVGSISGYDEDMTDVSVDESSAEEASTEDVNGVDDSEETLVGSS
jgi:hypothetical protein